MRKVTKSESAAAVHRTINFHHALDSWARYRLMIFLASSRVITIIFSFFLLFFLLYIWLFLPSHLQPSRCITISCELHLRQNQKFFSRRLANLFGCLTNSLDSVGSFFFCISFCAWFNLVLMLISSPVASAGRTSSFSLCTRVTQWCQWKNLSNSTTLSLPMTFKIWAVELIIIGKGFYCWGLSNCSGFADGSHRW